MDARRQNGSRILRRAIVLTSVAVVFGLSTGGLARAQYAAIDPSTTFNPNNTLTDSFNRGENVSVRERPRPDYQPEGIHLGGFMVYPKLTLGAAFDDNIYAQQSGAVSDAIFTVAPEIDFQSTWSRNALAGYVRDSQSFYVNHSGEDVNQYGAGLSGKYEFGDSVLSAATDYGRYALSRTAANSLQGLSEHPIEYDYTDASAVLSHTFNRLRLAGRFDYQDYSYLNGEEPGGAVVFENNFSHYIETYSGKLEYAVSPDTAVYVAGAYNERQYALHPPTVAYTSNSTGYNITGGVNFDVTHLVRGDVQLGYLDQEYASSLFHDIKGLSAKGQVEWFPTQLTTVTLTGLRAVGDSGVIGSAGYINATGGLQVDHELLRNLILTLTATTAHNSYYGASRVDQIWSIGASADWLLNRRVGLGFGYAHSDQTSSGSNRGPSFADDRGTISTALKF